MEHVKKIEDYLLYLQEHGYEPEQLEEVRIVRTTHEPMTFEMWQFLVQQPNTVERFIKLKRPRTLWVSEDGEIKYLSHYDRQWAIIGKFLPETE